MNSAAMRFGFIDELNKLAAEGAPEYPAKPKRTRKPAGVVERQAEVAPQIDPEAKQPVVKGPPEAAPPANPPAVAAAAAEAAAPPPAPEQGQEPMPEPEGPSTMDKLRDHFGTHGKKYLIGAGALGAAYGLKKAWPSIKRFGRGVGRAGARAASAAKYLIPVGVATYGLGRGLKAGERQLQRETQRDAERAEAAQGRYKPFDVD